MDRRGRTRVGRLGTAQNLVEMVETIKTLGFSLIIKPRRVLFPMLQLECGKGERRRLIGPRLAQPQITGPALSFRVTLSCMINPHYAELGLSRRSTYLLWEVGISARRSTRTRMTRMVRIDRMGSDQSTDTDWGQKGQSGRSHGECGKCGESE